ncbi:exo-beta-N-acetylmuramidase NamZ family protein [Sporomusa acidovorans]|uniref:DUF1343 domain-containing protein n=1 Tax=Sporomusa acidovorans (strain ATCC 49682 / DSM 3132 / Mol) TaxID=1123286 RepID=A0ABZ3J9Y4_SPOA4|nr:DUF1343 domain-containing protein [Sporomusa acidovorans]OZC21752.1 hypothetical protein SPACI_18270 [Sporomusa acidovorans DSM 3132]SDD58164.1 Uncharacterized conserved protein YbbC, DUF1343 family [Sporomusa acidovorans]
MKTKYFGFVIMFVMAVLLGGVATGCANSTDRDKQKVKLGIDQIDEHLNIFAGKRVGLITNATGMNSQFQSSIDVLQAKTQLVVLFSPEHGIRGAVPAGDKVSGQTDGKTGLPVYSLYGATKKPTSDMLENLDILAFDIQDVGARAYTYIYTMAYAMQAAKENGKTFVVFDRPNPVGGMEVEGGLIKPGFESFIGLYPIPIRHGMTVGELAGLFNKEFGIGCDLVVIKMKGWHRDLYFDETGLPWVMTSPNIPTPDTALVYPGTGIFGGTNISEGVGTTRPFDFVGAPWLDAENLANRMNAMKLPGVVFRPAHYLPRFGNFAGETCNGVQLHITDRKAFRPVRTGLSLLFTVQELSDGQFAYNFNGKGAPMIDLITGDDGLRLGRQTLAELLADWDQEAKQFKEMSKAYYLYPTH